MMQCPKCGYNTLRLMHTSVQDDLYTDKAPRKSIKQESFRCSNCKFQKVIETDISNRLDKSP